MKKLATIPVLLFVVLVAALSGCKKTLNRNITLNKSDKNPYGAWYARTQLDWLFPQAPVFDNTESPAKISNGNWPQLSLLTDGFVSDSGHALYMVLTQRFVPTAEEWEHITDFAATGNSVWISANYFGERLTDSFHLRLASADAGEGSLQTSFLFPADTGRFIYPGFGTHDYFTAFDSLQWQPLATDENGKVVLVASRDTAQGHWVLQSTPLCLSNFFLLHKQNKTYYDRLARLFPDNIEAIVWDDYFRRPVRPKDFNEWSVMTRSPALRWSLFLALLAATLYIVSEVKRRQRMIPVLDPLANSSVDFVKTVGRLYFNRHDNADLSQKIVTLFREQVREKYGLHSAGWDAAFEKALQYKSGKPADEVSRLLIQVRQADNMTATGDEELLQLNRSIDHFFKNNN